MGLFGSGVDIRWNSLFGDKPRISVLFIGFIDLYERWHWIHITPKQTTESWRTEGFFSWLSGWSATLGEHAITVWVIDPSFSTESKPIRITSLCRSHWGRTGPPCFISKDCANSHWSPWYFRTNTPSTCFDVGFSWRFFIFWSVCRPLSISTPLLHSCRIKLKIAIFQQ